MLVKTKAKFLYYKMNRKNQGDVFEIDDQDFKDYENAVQPVKEAPKKRGRPKKS